MRDRGVRMAAIALFVTVLALVTACGAAQPPPEFTGNDTEETAPPEARDVMLNALQTMFTWSPAKDASAADAYNRALPFLGKELRDGANNRVERGNSPQWQDWKAQKAEVTAQAWLVSAEHPKDAPDTIQRSIVLTQTVKAPDGRELDSTTFNIDRVVAKKGPQGWRVETIAFFPENPPNTGTCAPGTAHQPPPDGPCAPIPPPPAKQCPDGSTVPADQVCPPAQTGPKTKTCPDGTTVPAGSACPTTGTGSTTPCPSGQSPDANGKCVTPETTCPSGQTKDTNGTCVTPETTCPDGQTKDTNGTCVTPETTCPDGQTKDTNGICVTPETTCPDGQTKDTNGTCQYGPCENAEQTRDSNGVCQYGPCPNAQQTRDSNGVCQYGPCPNAQQTRDSSGTCQYPKCPYTGQTRNSSGVCACPEGLEPHNSTMTCDIHLASWDPTRNPARVIPFGERTAFARDG
jgi:hypothetical protein